MDKKTSFLLGCVTGGLTVAVYKGLKSDVSQAKNLVKGQLSDFDKVK